MIANEESGALKMVFQFEHMGLDWAAARIYAAAFGHGSCWI